MRAFAKVVGTAWFVAWLVVGARFGYEEVRNIQWVSLDIGGWFLVITIVGILSVLVYGVAMLIREGWGRP